VQDFRASARAAGIDEATLHSALDTARWLPRVIALDQTQPEFSRPVWDYLDLALAAPRISRGQEQLRLVRAQADAVATHYGVPAEVLLAIWGMESDYGRNVGDIPTVDALATLAFEGRRAEWARGQLLAALKILQNHDIARAQMLGSWAGAMGQTQFLPSNFLAYAVDADGDGRRDLWGSVPDVLASTANFLARSGWQAGQPWGLEVRLAAGFDMARADPALRQAASQWASEGVQTLDGTPLPDLADSAVLLPAGARGPAFLVGANFRSLLRYNNATSYALAVGLLAQRLQGGAPVQAPWPRDLQTLTRSQLLDLQTALNARGFDSGKPDGMLGEATQRGIRGFQRSLGLPADGYPSLELLQRLTSPTQSKAGSLEQTYAQLRATPGRVMRLQPEASQIRIQVFRAGRYANLGHNHVLTAPVFTGFFFWPEQGLAAARCDLEFRLDQLVFDLPAQRAALGPDFASVLSDAAIAATREHMLGPENMQADQFPLVRIQCLDISAQANQFVARIGIEIHGQTRTQQVPLTVTGLPQHLDARASVRLRQSDFGVRPYAVMGGLLAVQDELLVDFQLQGQPADTQADTQAQKAL
jgi:lytic murein transglycosylase